jgi:amidase
MPTSKGARWIAVVPATLLLSLLPGAARLQAQNPPPPAPSGITPFSVEEASLADVNAALQARRVTSRQLVEQYLSRIATLDRRGPTLRHVLETNPDAASIADQLDKEREGGKLRGPLHGIPILLKDNIDTADGMTTTAGSLALAGSKPPRDAFIVERLRAAGAILLGKTNMSEWANFRSSKSSSGWSGRGGQGKNPYALDRSPCGSSSGTGGAIAASFAVMGVGTETDGSIVCPSSANALVGIKPTVGLVSRAGIIPISHSQDTAGPMARSVADAAALLNALAGEDPRDPATAASKGKAEPDYTRFLDKDALRGARIGVARKKFFGYSDSADRLAEHAITALKAAGAVIVDPADIPNAGQYDEAEMDVLLYEFKADLNAYLAGLGPQAPVKSLQEIIDFNDRNPARELPFFGQDLFLKAQRKGPLTDPAYRRALATAQRSARSQGIDKVMRQHKLDALIAPTTSPAWNVDLINGDHYLGASSTPAAVAGYPSISVPMGFVRGLPVGLSFIGGAWSEGRLIALAHAFEQATRHRKPPRFAATADLLPP